MRVLIESEDGEYYCEINIDESTTLSVDEVRELIEQKLSELKLDYDSHSDLN